MPARRRAAWLPRASTQRRVRHGWLARRARSRRQLGPPVPSSPPPILQTLDLPLRRAFALARRLRCAALRRFPVCAAAQRSCVRKQTPAACKPSCAAPAAQTLAHGPALLSRPRTEQGATMGRMHTPGKGMSSSALPYKRSPPSWLKTTAAEVRARLPRTPIGCPAEAQLLGTRRCRS